MDQQKIQSKSARRLVFIINKVQKVFKLVGETFHMHIRKCWYQCNTNFSHAQESIQTGTNVIQLQMA